MHPFSSDPETVPGGAPDETCPGEERTLQYTKGQHSVLKVSDLTLGFFICPVTSVPIRYHGD